MPNSLHKPVTATYFKVRHLKLIEKSAKKLLPFPYHINIQLSKESGKQSPHAPGSDDRTAITPDLYRRLASIPTQQTPVLNLAFLRPVDLGIAFVVPAAKAFSGWICCSSVYS